MAEAPTETGEKRSKLMGVLDYYTHQIQTATDPEQRLNLQVQFADYLEGKYGPSTKATKPGETAPQTEQATPPVVETPVGGTVIPTTPDAIPAVPSGSVLPPLPGTST